MTASSRGKAPPSIRRIETIDRGQTSRLYFGNDLYADVSLEWMAKYKPKRGGYYLEYPDGHATYVELINGSEKI